jgi:tRNA(Ile)-lysidine synthase
LLLLLQMTYLLNQLEQSCILQNLIQPGSRLLISCSGGQDSITLLFLLVQLKPRWNWKLGSLHCNHMWRPTSISSGSKLSKICLCFRVNCHVSIAGSQVQNEDDARVWRTRALSRIAYSHYWLFICTGHTASDRVETLLSNLLRGSSSWGLRSISWLGLIYILMQESGLLRSIPLVRPALGISRVEFRNYATRWKLPLCYDVTNEDQRIRRNRIRHELLPYLRHWWNPQIDKILAQSAELTSWETIYYDLFCIQLCQQYEWIAYGAVRFPWSIVQSMPISLRTRLLSTFIIRASVFIAPFQSLQIDFEFVALLLESKTFTYKCENIYIIRNAQWIKLIVIR